MVHSNYLDPEEGTLILGASWEDPTDIGACLLECAKRLHDRQFIAASDGSISVRVGDDEIWTTPTHVMKAYARPDDMAVVTIKNEVDKGAASSERALHLSIYRHAEKARAVIHAQPPHAVALSLAFPEWRALPTHFIPDVILATGGVPILSYAYPLSIPMIQSLTEQLPHHRAVMFARHSVVTWGETLDEAYQGIERIEQLCRTLFLAHTLQPGRNLQAFSTGEVEALAAARARIGNRLF